MRFKIYGFSTGLLFLIGTFTPDTGAVTIIALGNNSPGTLPDHMTLTSGTINSGRLSVQVDDDENGVYDPDVLTASIARRSAAAQ